MNLKKVIIEFLNKQQDSLRDLIKAVITSVSLNQIVLFLILIVALLIRLTGIGKGLPYLHHYDEPFIASNALQMLNSGDLNPHWFSYGGLTMYLCLLVDIFHFLFLMGQKTLTVPITNVQDIVIDDPIIIRQGQYIWNVSHPTFYLWNRALMVFFGTGVVLTTYWLGKQLSGNYFGGLISAIVIAISATMIHHSRFITPNMVGVFFTTATIFFSLKFHSSKDRWYLAYSLISCGMAIATKYNLGVFLLIPLTLGWLNHKHLGIPIVNATFAMMSLTFLIFFLFNPYILADFTTFLNEVGNQVRHYKVHGHGSHTIDQGWPHMLLQIKQFKKDFGWVLFTLCGLGAFISIKNKGGWIVLLAAVVYFFYMTRQRVDFHRNFLPMYPFLAVWVGLSCQWLYEKINNSLLQRSLTTKRVLLIVLSVSFMIFLSIRVKNELEKGFSFVEKVETRSQIINLLNDKYAQENMCVAFAEELRMHQQDLARLSMPFKVMSHIDFDKNKDRFDLFVSGRFNSKRLSFNERDSLYNSYYPESTIEASIPGNGINLRILSIDPTIHLYQFPIPAEDVRIQSFYKPKTFREIIVDGSSNYLGAWGGEYATKDVLFSAGEYEILMEVRGNMVDGESPRLSLLVGNNTLLTFDTPIDYAIVKVRLTLEDSKQMPIRINYLNDYVDPEKNLDRNFFVKDILVRHLGR